MIRLLIICSVLLVSELSFGQYLYTQDSTQIYVSSDAILQLTGDAIFDGELINQGQIQSQGHLDFLDNKELGSISLTGSEDQVISGGELVAIDFNLSKNGLAILTATQLEIYGELALESGILSTELSKLVVKSGEVSGGAENAFVQGALSIETRATNDLKFPIGRVGNYQPLTVHEVPAGFFTAEVQEPNVDFLIPGDSLVGIADEAVWLMTHKGETALNSLITIDYSNLDLQAFPHANPIRAAAYRPVIAFLAANDKFRSLLAGVGSTSSLTGSGTSISRRSIHLNDTSILLAIGVSPSTDELKFYVPTVFTPSGDLDNNRRFRSFLIGTTVGKVEMQIWDQRNVEVFAERATDVPLEKTGWDGSINGGDAPQGVYYYSIKLTSTDGDFEKKGTVLLIR